MILLRTLHQSSKSCIQDPQESVTIWKTRIEPRSTCEDIDASRNLRQNERVVGTETLSNGPTRIQAGASVANTHTHTTQRWHLLPLKDENMWWKFKICYFLLHYNLRAYSIYINQSVLEVLFQQWHQSMYLLSKLWYQGCLKIRSDYWIELCRSIKHKKAWNVTNFRLYNSKILQVPQTLWGLLSNCWSAEVFLLCIFLCLKPTHFPWCSKNCPNWYVSTEDDFRV